MPLLFRAATDAGEARWIETALRRHEFAHVGSVAPSSDFEATVAVRHAAWRCKCKDDADAAAFASGHGGRSCQPIRWTDAIEAGLPVVYGVTFEETKYGWTKNLGTQYRRIDTGWVMQTLPDGGVATLIRPGDRWIGGPSEGTAPADIAQALHDVLAPATSTPTSCWFGAWEGFGYFTDADRAGASIGGPGRRWLLFRGAVQNMLDSFDPDQNVVNSIVRDEDRDYRQGPNLVWPADRAWCLATEIDAEVTLVAGSRALIEAIVASPLLEASEVAAEDRLPWFGDLLQPVVEKPPDVELPQGFESRHPPAWVTDMRDERMARLIEEDEAWLRDHLASKLPPPSGGPGQIIFVAKADPDDDEN